jgi:hypothetical protein
VGKGQGQGVGKGQGGSGLGGGVMKSSPPICTPTPLQTVNFLGGLKPLEKVWHGCLGVIFAQFST